jgi:uncharacterized DUF497 family protein
MARLHENFEWDDDKAGANFRKHRVSFDEAALALEDEEGDRFHLDVDDPSHSESEDRFITFASLPTRRNVVLIISWTDRSTDDERITRIISAHRADKQEKARYVREIGE